MQRAPNYSHYSSNHRFKNEYSILNRIPQEGAIDKFQRQISQSLESIKSLKRARKLKKISRLHDEEEQQYYALTHQLSLLQNNLNEKQKRERMFQSQFLDRFQKSFLPLIQQKNTNTDKQSNPFNNFTPQFLPYHMMPTYSPYSAQYPPYQNPMKDSRMTHARSLHSMPRKSSRQSVKSSHKKYSKFSAERSKKLLSKFRIAGYVIYFSLYFVKFAQNITKLRYDKFLSQQSMDIERELDKFYRNQIKKKLNLHKITLNNIDLSSKKQIQDEKKSMKKKTIIGNLHSEEKLLFSVENFTLSLGIIQNILKIYFEKLQQLVKSGYFQPYYDLFSCLCIDKTFVHDYIFTEPELNCFTFNQRKGYLILSDKWERFLLINAFFMQGCLIPTIFDFLNLDQNPNMIQKKAKKAGVSVNQYIRSANESMIAYLILLIIVQNKYSYLTNQKQGNLYKIDENLRPVGKIIPTFKEQQFSAQNTFFDFPMEGLKGILDIKNIILKNYQWFTRQIEAQFNQIFEDLYAQIKKHQKLEYKRYFETVLKMKKIKTVSNFVYQRRQLKEKPKKQKSKKKQQREKTKYQGQPEQKKEKNRTKNKRDKAKYQDQSEQKENKKRTKSKKDKKEQKKKKKQ